MSFWEAVRTDLVRVHGLTPQEAFDAVEPYRDRLRRWGVEHLALADAPEVTATTVFSARCNVVDEAPLPVRVDRHAIREVLGPVEAAGWLVWFPDLSPPSVNNRLFRTEEEAVNYARTIHASHQPVVKAVRWA